MLIENRSKYLLKKTRAKAKMYEYKVPLELHVRVEEDIPELLLIAIGTIGNVSAEIVRTNNANLYKKSEDFEKLRFATDFFDAFSNSEIDNDYQYYYFLFGSVAYYLSDKFGSSRVLVDKIIMTQLDLNANGIDMILANFLQNKCEIKDLNNPIHPHKNLLLGLSQLFDKYNSNDMINIDNDIKFLRTYIYDCGTSLEILLVDCLLAIIIIKQKNLAVNVLPEFSNLSRELWMKAINEGCFIKELWPSQFKLGEQGIYNGKSSVIQMATGTGKTKAISLIIYSAFLSNRSNCSIIVAPFRSLCREIAYDLERDFKFDNNVRIEQLSDVLRKDDLLIEFETKCTKSVVIVTPEKLMFIISQQPEILGKIDQIIFDEAHLFDDSNRGTSYELLVSAIRKYIRADVQKILISAVISNASDLNHWINNGEGVVISDNSIKSTGKQIAFTDWRTLSGENYGYLHFVDPENPDIEEFFVPRLINISQLEGKPRERNTRYFPEVNNKGKVKPNDIAIYYALYLSGNGGSAIFCSTKISANNILKRILELENRMYDIKGILKVCCPLEVKRIAKLIEDNYGKDNIYYDGALKGLFVHHAGISNGLKNSIEYAMQKSLIFLVVCTSTLAQGVNLPIRYLIISNLYQGNNPITVRNFQNLIGRVGRPGVYTEGNILFTETGAYNKTGYKNKWYNYKRVLDSNNSEPCSSTLIDLVREQSFLENRSFTLFDYLLSYYNNKENYKVFETEINELPENEKNILRYNLSQYISIMHSVESFAMSFLIQTDYVSNLNVLLEETYGYFLANEHEKTKLIELFNAVGNYIIDEIPNENDRKIYSRSLLGIEMNQNVELWLNENIVAVNNTHDEIELFEIISPFLFEFIDNSKVKKIEKINCFVEIGKMWISGRSYYEILTYCNDSEYKINYRRKYNEINLDDVITICDNGLGYSTILLITALTEIFSNIESHNENVYKSFLNLSSELRYGLPDKISILIYEIGFSDRVLAQKIAEKLHITQSCDNKVIVTNFLCENNKEVLEIVEEYPQVYIDLISNL